MIKLTLFLVRSGSYYHKYENEGVILRLHVTDYPKPPAKVTIVIEEGE